MLADQRLVSVSLLQHNTDIFN